MLIQFKIKNSTSFMNEVNLCLAKSSCKGHETTNVTPTNYDKVKLLKSACIYGPNASGKTNVTWCLSQMREFVLGRTTELTGLPIANFRLNTESEALPTLYEATFLHKGQIFRFGFEATQKEITREWLYGIVNKKEITYFERNRQNFYVSPHFKEGDRPLQLKTRPTALFVFVVAQFNGPTALRVLEWFNRLILLSSTLSSPHKTLNLAKTPEGKISLINFLKAADIGVEDIVIKTTKPTFSVKHAIDVHQDSFELVHRKYDKNNQEVGRATLPQHFESTGTLRLLGMFGHIQDVLTRGGVLVVDEIELNLHPLIVEFLLKQFHRESNHLAQLIFTTHDLNTLNSNIFRRDQIWFTEKDSRGVSDLFSLCEYRGIRRNASFAKDYKLGKYRAIPNINKHYTFQSKML